jgi:hypothetical protein
MRERADIAFGVFRIKADHVDHRIERLFLHGFFELITLAAISANYPDIFWNCAALTPVIAGDFVSFFQQDSDYASTDITGSANYTNFHSLNLFLVFSVTEKIIC